MRRWVVGGITLAEMLIFGLVATFYAEWGSSWIHIPIGFWGALIGGLLIFPLWLFGNLRERHVGGMVIAIAVAIMPITMLLGITFAEPKLEEAQSTGYSSAAYDYSHTPSGRVYYQFINFGGSGGESSAATSSTSAPKLSGKGWGVVILIVMVIVLIFASAIVPHFWVAAGLGALLLLTTITIIEFMADDREEEPRLPEYWPTEDFSYSRHRRRR